MTDPTARSSLGAQFRLLLAARLCVWTAGGITGVALPLALYQRTGNAALTALLAALEVAPYLLVGLVAGVVADRCRIRQVAIATCLLCAVVTGSVPLAHSIGLVTVPHLFAVALAAGISLVFFDAAMFAALPAIVTLERVPQAFASMTATATIIALVGPTVGGLLAAAITPERTLLADAILLGLAAGGFVLLREPHRTRSDKNNGVAQDIREGLHFIARTPLVRGLTALGAGNSTAEGLLSGMLVATVVAVYGKPDEGPHIGIAYSAIALGALIGSTLLPRVRRRLALRTVTASGLLIAAVGLAVWSQQSVYAVGIGALVLYQLGATSVILNGITERARVTPAELQGRVNTTARMFAWGGQPLGALSGAAIVGLVGIPGTHLIGVALLALTAVISLRVLRPSALSPTPADPTEPADAH